jgi:hypothetical protein
MPERSILIQQLLLGSKKKKGYHTLQYCNPNPLQLTLANDFFFHIDRTFPLYHVIQTLAV